MRDDAGLARILARSNLEDQRMMLKALITEQLDSDGTLKTLKMRPGLDQHIVVAFAHEYAEPKDGPFHFLEPDDERRFREGFAQCRARHLSNRNFSKVGD